MTTTEELPAPKAILIAVMIEAHDWDHAKRQLHSIEYRLDEAAAADQELLEVVSGEGWILLAHRDPDRTQEDAERDLRKWHQERVARRSS